MKFFKGTNIDFISKRYAAFAISAVLMLMAVFAATVVRPNFGIDFTGGILMQVSFERPADFNNVREVFAREGLGNVELQSTEGNGIIMRLQETDMNKEEFQAYVKQFLTGEFPGNELTIERFEFVGPAVGRHLARQAVYAFIFAFAGMIIYIAFRFRSPLWGIAGVMGIVHDVIVCLGFFMLTGKEISITTVAALLTVAGYSINDKIVLFDRIRENMRLSAKDSFLNIINKSINGIMMRALVTTFTTFLVACSLFFLGGEVLHGFAFILVIGLVVCVYSSIFLCAPFVYEWEARKLERYKRSKA
ncbi:MAG: protein translocase subunit SecF [Elusimicrobia bacterium]|nr:protein translocase subunit SecF [Elusimicrobiota bacterium]